MRYPATTATAQNVNVTVAATGTCTERNDGMRLPHFFTNLPTMAAMAMPANQSLLSARGYGTDGMNAKYEECATMWDLVCKINACATNEPAADAADKTAMVQAQ